MNAPFLALITPLTEPPVTPPVTPPGVPTFPIAPNYPPGNYPSNPIFLPGYPPGWNPNWPSNGLPPMPPPNGNYPSNPIFYPPGTSPGYPGWGGSGPHPEFPIYIPDLKPSHPISLPGDPWWGTITPPIPPVIPQPPQPPIMVYVRPLPVQTPPVVPPAGIPQDAVLCTVWFGPGTIPTLAWIPPYGAQNPNP